MPQFLCARLVGAHRHKRKRALWSLMRPLQARLSHCRLAAGEHQDVDRPNTAACGVRGDGLKVLRVPALPSRRWRLVQLFSCLCVSIRACLGSSSCLCASSARTFPLAACGSNETVSVTGAIGGTGGLNHPYPPVRLQLSDCASDIFYNSVITAEI